MGAFARARLLVRVKSQEPPRSIRNILRKMQIPPGSLAKGNHACQSARAHARMCVCVCICVCTCAPRDRHPPHLFVFRSRMPVRKLRRLRRNPRRRHRDFRHRLRLPLRSPSPSSIKVPIRRLMFQVGWVKADTKAIQAIHDHVITHNKRVSVSHSDHSIWNLHIKGVQKEDGGVYMCQINTDPMKSQVYIALNSFK